MNTSGEMNGLLATKLDFPVIGARANIIHRRRITERLEAGIASQVMACVSPAGYGKTTALGEWISYFKAPERQFAWVTLDAFDNTPLRFWSYITGALRKAVPGLQYHQQKNLGLDHEPFDFTQLDPLLIEIAQLPYQLYLVLDDYHVITNEVIHSAMDYLIEHQPKNFHLIFSSRDNLPLKFSKLRIRGQLLEIFAADLAFTQPETSTFLTNVMNLNLSPEQVQMLMDITVGWITGIQLAALTLQVQPDILAQPDFQRMKANFSGAHRQILEYFTEEVLNKLKPDIMSFLVNTSILNQLSASLCNALVERSDSQEVIAALERGNLFIIPLDNQQRWYRYHPLFAGALKAYLERVHPQRVPELHHKACDWLLENGYPLQAVEHALAVNEMETAAKILDAYAVQALATFDLDRLVKWIGRFSDGWIRKHPKLGIYDALANIHFGQLNNIEMRLQQITDGLDAARDYPDWEADQREIRWEIQSIRAIADCMRGNYQSVIDHAAGLIETVPNEKNWIFGALQQWLAEAMYETGNLEDAIVTFERAAQTALDQNLLSSYVYAMCEVARICKEQGQLQNAERRYAALCDYATRAGLDSSVKVLIQSALLEIAVERNDLDAAGRFMKKIKDDLDRDGESSPIYYYPVIVSSCIARYELANGDYAAAHSNLVKAVRVLRGYRKVNIYFLSHVIDMLVRAGIQSQKLASSGNTFMEEVGQLISEEDLNLGEQIAFARLFLARQEIPQAWQMLIRLEAHYRSIGKGERLLETLVLKSQAYWSSQQEEEAFSTLSQALQMAAPEHYVRPFLDEGQAMKTLLDAFLACMPGNDSASYAEILRKEFDQQQARPPRQLPTETAPVGQAHSLPDRLFSPRELKIMKMIGAGASSKDVASEMVISANTVKVHLKRIYRKLNIHTRGELLEYIKKNDLGSL